MDTKNTLFWLLVAALLGSAGFFGFNAEAQRRQVQRSHNALMDAEVVTLSKVIDGDTVVVQKQDGSTVAIRLLGIKGFDPQREKDPTSRFGLAAMDALERLMDEKPLRVELHETPKDKYGRTIAELHADQQNIGLALVERGLTLVYTLYPFSSMPTYLRAQEVARAEREGLWADPRVAERADLLAREWRRQAR
jgi:endonuclease YncB( thermonuclease family)